MNKYLTICLLTICISACATDNIRYDNIQTYSEDAIATNIDERDSLFTNTVIQGFRIYENKKLCYGFYTKGSDSLINHNQLDLWIYSNRRVYILKTIDIIVFDFLWNIGFSSDGTMAICYNNYEPPYGYDDEDKYIDIFDIQDLNHIKKQTIEIEKCVDYRIIRDSSLFCTEYITDLKDGTEDYSYAIYKSKLYDENNRIPVAIGAEMRVISDDGRYILAIRELYGKNKFIIIDASSSKYAYLWEDQNGYKSIYYDSERDQFAFDYGTYIKYLIMPDSFPHDALEYRYTDKFENESFWNKIQE